jgi:hypothetical protein
LGLPLRSSRATVPGFDLTLSSPKGVSVTWALADRATAEQIVTAHDRGVGAAITIWSATLWRSAEATPEPRWSMATVLLPRRSVTGRAVLVTRSCTPTCSSQT